MAAGRTYTPIGTTTLSTASSTVTFSSIPGTYTDLVLVVSGKSTVAGVQDGLAIRVNSDSGANYSATYMRGDGTSALSSRNTGDTYYRLAANAMGGSSGSFAATLVHFMNYSNTTTFKTILARSNNAGSGTDAVTGLWRNTAAITSVICVGYNGNLDTGSTFTLYGIAAA